MPNIFNPGGAYGDVTYGVPAPFGFGGGARPSPFASYDNAVAPQPGQMQNARAPDFSEDASYPQMLNVSSNVLRPSIYPLPGFTPLPPDVFAEWRKHAEHGLTGLLNAFQGSGFRGGSTGPNDEPGCKEEWDDARQFCQREMAKPNPPRGVTGGYTTVEDCTRGNVSERCGGNLYVRKPLR